LYPGVQHSPFEKTTLHKSSNPGALEPEQLGESVCPLPQIPLLTSKIVSGKTVAWHPNNFLMREQIPLCS
jgi:hypothetical protein